MLLHVRWTASRFTQPVLIVSVALCHAVSRFVLCRAVPCLINQQTYNRYHSLRQLFSIPDSFVEEFVVQEPELLCMSADTLKAKFDSLLRR